MLRVIVAAGFVIAGGGYWLTGSGFDGEMGWALLLPVVSAACIALLWE